MRKEIIKTDNYLIIVSDDEIKVGDVYININTHLIFTEFKENYPDSFKTDTKKIIAHLPLNDSPILEGVDLLPPLPIEDDVEDFALEKYPVYPFFEGTQLVDDDTNYTIRKGFKTGYNKAKEKYKYTEEDIRKAFESGMEYGRDMALFYNTDKVSRTEFESLLDCDEYVQSLSQPMYPIAFELQDKKYRVKSGTIDEHKQEKAGYEYYELVGKYIYND